MRFMLLPKYCLSFNITCSACQFSFQLFFLVGGRKGRVGCLLVLTLDGMFVL